MPVFAPLVALHVLEAAEAGAEDPHPPSLTIRVVKHGLRAKSLFKDDVRLLLGFTDIAIGSLRCAQVDLADKRSPEPVRLEA